MKKLLLVVMLMVCAISVGNVKQAKAQLSLSGFGLSHDVEVTDNGDFTAKLRSSVIYGDTYSPILKYVASPINVVPIADYTAVEIIITPVGAVTIDKKTNMPKAKIRASWDGNQSFTDFEPQKNGDWKFIIPMKGRDIGTLSFSAQIVAETGKKKSSYRFLSFKIPFFGKNSTINKTVGTSLDFECFHYGEDRSDDPKAIALWVKDMTGRITSDFYGTVPYYDMPYGTLKDDNAPTPQTPQQQFVAPPAPIVRAFSSLSPSESEKLVKEYPQFNGMLLFIALQDVDNMQVKLMSGDTVVATKVISCKAGKVYAFGSTGITDVIIGDQSWARVH